MSGVPEHCADRSLAASANASMESDRRDERMVRAVHDQALFRMLNERLKELNEAFESRIETFTVACECAGVHCIEPIEIRPQDYVAVRREPRRFVVRPGHVDAEVELIVAQRERYIVVEKIGKGAEVAETLARERPTG